MLRHKNERGRWLEFELFQEFPEITHAVCLESYSGEVISAYQVHGAKVIEAVEGPEEKCDGLLTSKTDRTLLIKHADCQAALFYDPVKKVIGSVHAGWRGQVQNIYREVVGKLRELYGCSPEDIRVGISPSLGPCCAQFIHYREELPSDFWKHQVRPLYFDLWEIARQQLQETGILPRHIQVAEMCTCCHSDGYRSYRRDKIKGFNHSSVIRMSRFRDF